MRKLFFISGVLMILTAVGLFAYEFFFLRNQKGALQITSLPESKVYLNGELIGTTPLCLCGKVEKGNKRIKDVLSVGEYAVRLEPVTGNFLSFQENVTVEPSVLTVIDRKFASGASSESVVIFLTKFHDAKKNKLTVTSIPDGAEVMLDGAVIGMTPLNHEAITESDHALMLQKEGYKTKTVRIRATNGYALTTKVSLGIDPLFFSKDKEATQGGELSPSPTLGVTRVKVLQTETGFLRVRESNSLAGKEIARVLPGETFELIDENEAWVQIRLLDGRLGWISKQYAEKIQGNLPSENVDNNNN